MGLVFTEPTGTIENMGKSEFYQLLLSSIVLFYIFIPFYSDQLKSDITDSKTLHLVKKIGFSNMKNNVLRCDSKTLHLVMKIGFSNMKNNVLRNL